MAVAPIQTLKQSNANFTIKVFLSHFLFEPLISSLGKQCPYGDRCSFAHGQEDLRAPQMMPPMPY